MDKKFFITWLVLFIAWFMGSFVVHHFLLGAEYQAMARLYRQPEEAQKLFHFMVIAHLLLSGAFLWIYVRGREAKPWLGQGIRFGAAVACLTVLPTYMIYFVVQPLPGAMVAKQMVFDSLLVVIIGVIAAFIYRDKPAS